MNKKNGRMICRVQSRRRERERAGGGGGGGRKTGERVNEKQKYEHIFYVLF